MGGIHIYRETSEKGSEMSSEQDIQNLIRLALSERGILNFRNNVGCLKDATGRMVRYGLYPGSSDIIGIMPDGRFLAIEVKKPGKKPTPEQLNFIEAIRRHGGIAGVVHSPEELAGLLE